MVEPSVVIGRCRHPMRWGEVHEVSSSGSDLFEATDRELDVSASQLLMALCKNRPELVRGDAKSAVMVGSSEFASSIEPRLPIPASPQKKEELTRIAGAIEALSDLIEVVLPAVLHLEPHLLVAAEERPRIVLDQIPEIDQGATGIAAPNPPHFNVAAEELLQDSPVANEGFVVRGDFSGEVLQDVLCLSPLGARPLD